MGRQQFLTRLALGRSAFEDVDDSIPILQLQPGQTGPEPVDETVDDGSGHYVQKYDAKARPFNPSIDKFNADMRAAQNEALELVGVVERKDQTDRLNVIRRKLARERRTTLLAAEHERGELLDFVLTPVRFLSRCWVEAFVNRIQIGLYDPARPMADILLSGWRARWKGGFRVSLATRFPAMGDLVAHVLIRIPLTFGVEHITGRLQSMVQKWRLPRRTTQDLFYGIHMVFEALLLAIDAALLPIEYYAFAQRMGLAPALPLLPPLAFCVPGNADSFYSFGWKPLAGFTLIRTLSSPASLLLLYKIFHFDEEDEGVPICALFTSYRYPKINAHQATVESKYQKVDAASDPVGWILHQGWKLRTRVLQWCGWSIHVNPDRRAEHEDNTNALCPVLTGPLPQSQPVSQDYRSTHLAHMPAQHLAQAIDKLYSHIVILPFESLMLRTIAATYMSSSMTAKTPEAIEASSRLYRPFGGGPLAMVLQSPREMSAWLSLGNYLSRLTLAMALSTSIDALLYCGMYSCTRHIGLTFFDWGRKDQIGSTEMVLDSNHNHSVVIEDEAPP